MLEPINKFFNNILESLLKPIQEWVLSLSWIKKCVFLLSASLPFIVYYNFDFFKDTLGNIEKRIHIEITGDNIYLNSKAKENLKLIINRLEGQCYGYVKNLKGFEKSNFTINPWFISQVVVALNDAADSSGHSINDNVRDSIIKFLNGKMVKSCNCWNEYGEDHHNIVISAWVLEAMSILKYDKIERSLEFILDSQYPDGSWSVFPSDFVEDNSSSYATALVIYSLKKISQNIDLSVELKSRIDEAVKGGLGWLTTHTDKGLWKNYPHSNDGVLSIPISGFVIHVISELKGPKDVLKISEKKWMEKLKGLPSVSANEASAHPIYLRPQRVAKDIIRHNILQGLLIGTVSLYRSGSTATKIKANIFLEELLRQDIEYYNQESNEIAWITAEILIALKELDKYSSSPSLK